jgi:putative glutamine amidotransferase
VTERPLIALSGRRSPASSVTSLPANFAGQDVELHISAYCDAVTAAGGLPVMLPCALGSTEVLERCDALVLTGGADVDPQRYGADPHPEVYGVDPRRDAVELALIDTALARGIPILAVCRGMQVLNVALGGTLVQHIDPADGEHHAAWDLQVDEAVHEVEFTVGSTASACFGSALGVNSLHHQALDRLGHGLVATGWAADGTIEAAEVPGRPLLAVQWHPELMAVQPDPAFRWIVEQALNAAATSAAPG